MRRIALSGSLATLLAAATLALLPPAQASIAPTTGSAGAGLDRRAEHARVQSFWTRERVAKAVPRDFVLDQGHFRPAAAKKPGGGGGSTGVLGASWPTNNAVAQTTGKVLFALGGSYYVCSASVVTDGKNGRTLILTAGHCVYDETNGQWATNWMFIPNYDAQPVALDRNGTFCASTLYGCWVADALVASSGFTTAGGFNTQATLHDYAFAVVSTGGKSGTAELDATVGSQAVNFSAGSQGATTYLFGYPAASKYNGTDLVYSSGALGLDPYNNNQTYRVASDMTGGSSGGPWFQSFNTTAGTGTIRSVTSYGYSSIKALHGPILNAETQAMFNAAKNTSGNLAYG